MIERAKQRKTIQRHLKRSPVVASLGARQVGKTTLAREIMKTHAGNTTLFDLERMGDVARLVDPELALGRLRGLVVLDEIQRRPDLFPTLRVLCDRPRRQARFLVLGSASPELLRQSSESLAGRITYHELTGLTLDEVGIAKLERLWLRGSFPRSYLPRTLRESADWREDFIRTFLERDVPQLGISIPAHTLERFWSMLAHYHGQIWNGSEFARSFGVSHHSVRRYLDALQCLFMVRVLKPWMANLRKRQVKAPKIYLRDSGILHSFLRVTTRDDLDRHPKVGASWEGFLLEAVIHQCEARSKDCYFWATHAGAELDLLIDRGSRRYGFEFKHTVAPAITKSMRTAMEDLGLNRLYVIHAGSETFPMSTRIRAVAASRLLEDLKPLR